MSSCAGEQRGEPEEEGLGTSRVLSRPPLPSVPAGFTSRRLLPEDRGWLAAWRRAGAAARDEAVLFQAASEDQAPRRRGSAPAKPQPFATVRQEARSQKVHRKGSRRGTACARIWRRVLLRPRGRGAGSLAGAAGETAKQGERPSTPRSLPAPTTRPASASPTAKR